MTVSTTDLSPESASASSRIGDYVRDRVAPQIRWYKDKSRQEKTKYIVLSILQLAGTAVVPVLNTYGCEFEVLLYASSVCASTAAILTGFVAIARPQENWIRYRHASNALESLRMRHEHRVQPFDEGDADRKFVDMVEQEISSESEVWRSRMQEKTG